MTEQPGGDATSTSTSSTSNTTSGTASTTATTLDEHYARDRDTTAASVVVVPDERRDAPGAPASVVTSAGARLRDGFREAPVVWYGLDESWRGERTLGSLCTGADGVVEYGSLVHGDVPSKRPDEASPRRFATVVSMAKLDRRPIGDPDRPRGFVEATTESTVAAVAGIGLLSDDWPWQLDLSLRQDWLHQQTELAYELAEHLDGSPWRNLALPVDGDPAKFRYRESEYGWVLAGETPSCWLAAYGRGVSAYGLGFVRLGNLFDYAVPDVRTEP
jgi:hypothetical protein